MFAVIIINFRLLITPLLLLLFSIAIIYCCSTVSLCSCVYESLTVASCQSAVVNYCALVRHYCGTAIALAVGSCVCVCASIDLYGHKYLLCIFGIWEIQLLPHDSQSGSNLWNGNSDKLLERSTVVE